MAASNGKGKRPARKSAQPTPAKRIIAGRSEFTPGVLRPIERRFLEKFRETGRIKEAALLVGIDRTMHYDWLARNPAYVEAFNEVLKIAEKSLEDRAYAELETRALDGVMEETEVQTFAPDANGQPKIVEVKRTKVRRRSDMLLVWLNNRFKGNPATLQVNAIGKNVQINVGNLRDLIERADAVLVSENGDAPIDMIESGEDD